MLHSRARIGAMSAVGGVQLLFHPERRTHRGALTYTAAITPSTLGTSHKTKSTASLSREEALRHELDDMRTAEPPVLFAGRYALLAGSMSGGQAAVHFARGADGGFKQYAIKLFVSSPEDYALVRVTRRCMRLRVASA
jgi:hypothetical protein